MDDDNFGVRWTGQIRPTQSGTYSLGIITTCKTNLYLNDTLIADTAYHFRDEFGDPRLKKSAPIELEAGKTYALKVEAGESYADAQVQLVWARPRTDPKEDLKREALAIARQADTIIMCMGLCARLEGEQMDIEIASFVLARDSTLIPEFTKRISGTRIRLILIDFQILKPDEPLSNSIGWCPWD